MIRVLPDSFHLVFCYLSLFLLLKQSKYILKQTLNPLSPSSNTPEDYLHHSTITTSANDGIVQQRGKVRYLCCGAPSTQVWPREPQPRPPEGPPQSCSSLRLCFRPAGSELPVYSIPGCVCRLRRHLPCPCPLHKSLQTHKHTHTITATSLVFSFEVYPSVSMAFILENSIN